VRQATQQRALKSLPVLLLPGLLLALLMQAGWHYYFNLNAPRLMVQPLKAPASPTIYRALSLGSQKLMGYILTLRLQLHDNQLGRNIRYRYLDYDALSEWLLTLYELNPQSDYPAFLASRIYSQVKDKAKIRKMISVVETLFDKNPVQHWRRMTEACVLAKHELKDLPLALRLAQKIANIPSSVKIPHWARDMKLVLLDELNELESAQLLISSMLQDDDIKDPDEIRFLQDRLLRIQQKLSAQQQKKPTSSHSVK
jgi:hypothetical protein